MEYQIEVKKTYKGKKDIDHYFFLTRSTDVELRDIENTDGNYPMNRQKLTLAINQYNALLKDIEKTMGEISKTVEILKSESDSIKGDGETTVEKIAEIQNALFKLNSLYSNLSNDVGTQATSIAELNARFSQLSVEFANLGTRVIENDTRTNDRLSKLENITFVPVTEERIASLFNIT